MNDLRRDPPHKPWLSKPLAWKGLLAGALLGALVGATSMCRDGDHGVKVSPVNGGGAGGSVVSK